MPHGAILCWGVNTPTLNEYGDETQPRYFVASSERDPQGGRLCPIAERPPKFLAEGDSLRHWRRWGK